MEFHPGAPPLNKFSEKIGEKTKNFLLRNKAGWFLSLTVFLLGVSQARGAGALGKSTSPLAVSSATVVVNSVPSGAKIFYSFNKGTWVDSGSLTNTTFSGAALGAYRVKLAKVNYADWVSEEKIVGAGDTVTFSTVLVPVGAVEVVSFPVGARVWYRFNGASDWVDAGAWTNYTFNSVSVGSYQVKLTKSGYADWESDVKTLTMGGKLLFSATLTPVGTVVYQSSPPGASVWVKWNGASDWENTGWIAPHVDSSAVPGTYQVKMTLDGYADWESDVFPLVEGGSLVFNAAMVPLGVLNVFSTPPGAKIQLKYQDAGDWTDVGAFTPWTSTAPAGSYRVKLTLAGYGDWESPSQTLGGGGSVTFETTMLPLGALSVKSTPSGARVWVKHNGEVDWREVGFDTPYVSSSAPVGTYQIKLTKLGYADWVSDVRVLPERGMLSFSTVLNPVGTVSVTSSPPGAQVFFKFNSAADWADAGVVTPFTTALAPTGIYQIKLVLAGFKDWVSSAQVLTAGGTLEWNTPLTPAGELTGTSVPSGARIWYARDDGPFVDSGVDTDGTVQGLGMGRYVVRFVKTGHSVWEESVTLTVTSPTASISGVLTPGTGVLDVQSLPAGADIAFQYNGGPWIDTGRRTPFTFAEASTGTYLLRLTRADHLPWESDAVNLSVGETVLVSGVLTALSTLTVTSTPEGAAVFYSLDGGAWVDTGANTNRVLTGMKPGAYRLRLAWSRGAVWESEVQTVAPGEAILFHGEPSQGNLTVRSTPPGATVWWSRDGGPWVFSGETTDHQWDTLAPGLYRVRLVKEGYADWVQDREVKDTGPVVLTARLRPLLPLGTALSEVSAQDGGTVGALEAEGVRLRVPEGALSENKSFWVGIALPDQLTDLFDPLLALLPGVPRLLVELGPARSTGSLSDLFPLRLEKEMSLTVPRLNAAVGLYFWEDGDGVWRPVDTRESGALAEARADGMGLYAVVEAPLENAPTETYSYPQPASGSQATLRWVGRSGGAVTVTLLNALGEKVLERTLDSVGAFQGGKTLGEFHLDLSSLSSGVYHYRLDSVDGAWSTQGRLAVVK